MVEIWKKVSTYVCFLPHCWRIFVSDPYAIWKTLHAKYEESFLFQYRWMFIPRKYTSSRLSFSLSLTGNWWRKFQVCARAENGACVEVWIELKELPSMISFVCILPYTRIHETIDRMKISYRWRKFYRYFHSENMRKNHDAVDEREEKVKTLKRVSRVEEFSPVYNRNQIKGFV